MARAGARPAAATLTAAAVLALCGCGSGDDVDAPENLASAVPADTLLYVELTLPPAALERAAVKDIAAHFPGGDDIRGLLLEEIDRGIAEDTREGEAPLTFEEDIEPWLGERAAVAMGYEGEDDDELDPIATVVETTDPDAAGEALEASAETSDDEVEVQEDGGAMRYVSADEEVTGMVGDLIVAAENEARFDAVVDVLEGDAESLADSVDFEYGVGDVDGAEDLGYMALDVEGVIAREIAVDPDAEVTTQEVMQYAEQAGFDLEEPLRFALTTTSGTARLDTSIAVTDPELAAGGEDLLEQVPAAAWGAALCPGCLEALKIAFDQGVAEAAARDGVSADEAQEILADLGLDTEALVEAIGPVAIFAGGSRPGAVTGAAVASIEDAGDVEDALEGVVGLIEQGGAPGVRTGPLARLGLRGVEGFSVAAPDLPRPVYVALAEDRLVVGLGVPATAAALATTRPLEETGRYNDLEAQLGEGFDRAGFAEFGPILSLIAASEAGDPEFLAAGPYLRPLHRLGLGFRVQDGRLIIRTAVTFD